MTPTELLAALKRLDLPVYRAAKLLGVDARTVRRWTQDPTEKGARRVPGPAAVFLRFLIAQGVVRRIAGAWEAWSALSTRWQQAVAPEAGSRPAPSSTATASRSRKVKA